MKRIFLLGLGTVFFSGVSIESQRANIRNYSSETTMSIEEFSEPDTILTIDSIPIKLKELDSLMLEIKKVNNENNK